MPDRAVLESAADYALMLNTAGSSVAWLTIEHSGAFGALYLAGASADHVFAHSSSGSESTTACWLAGGGGASTLAEGVCWNSAIGRAISAMTVVEAFPATATVRNVTAVASGAGASAQALRVQAANGATTSLTATGLIASGTAAVGGDIDVWATNGGSVTAALGYSNYSNTQTNVFDGTATLTPASANGNQTAEPLFEDAGGGDFEQAAGSPTIDAGDPAAEASIDLGGKPRPLGVRIDIGAHEADADTTAPTLVLTGRPPKATRKRKATFRFAATDDASAAEHIGLDCKLDAGKFRSCRSPKVYRRLKLGRHSFRVRATDEAGNSATARWRWRIRR